MDNINLYRRSFSYIIKIVAKDNVIFENGYKNSFFLIDFYKA